MANAPPDGEVPPLPGAPLIGLEPPTSAPEPPTRATEPPAAVAAPAVPAPPDDRVPPAVRAPALPPVPLAGRSNDGTPQANAMSPRRGKLLARRDKRADRDVISSTQHLSHRRRGSSTAFANQLNLHVSASFLAGTRFQVQGLHNDTTRADLASFAGGICDGDLTGRTRDIVICAGIVGCLSCFLHTHCCLMGRHDRHKNTYTLVKAFAGGG